MDEVTAWWVVAGALVGLELLTGTFYLLMLALGAAAGAMVASAGIVPAQQMGVAATVGGVLVLAWHFIRLRRRARPDAADPNLHLDVGQTVDVIDWTPDGHARVIYRGTQWDARHRGRDRPQPGPHRIHAVEGTHLVLEKI